MPFTLIQNASGAASSVSFSAPVGSGHFVIVAYNFFGGNVSPTIADDKGNSYTVLAQQYDGGSDFRTTGVAWAKGLTNGPTTISISGSGLSNFGLCINEFSAGSGTTANSDVSTTALSGTTSVTAGPITPSYNGELIYAVGWVATGPITVPGSPWTVLNNTTPPFAGPMSDVYQVQTTAAAISVAFSGGSGNESEAVIASFYIVTPLTADTWPPLEFGSLNLRRDQWAYSESLYAIAPADNLPPVEYLSGATIALSSKNPAEWLGGGQSFDALLPTEALGAVNDPPIPIEWTAIGKDPVSDASLPIEALHNPTITGDANPPLEWAGAAAGAAGGHSYQPLEAFSGAAADSRVPLESSGSAATAVTGDALARLEILTRQLRDWLPPLEVLGNVPVGYIQIEWLPRVVTDGNPQAEIVATLRRDAMPPTEQLGGARADTSPQSESLALALRDSGLPIEGIGALVLVADALLRLELLCRAQGDRRVPAESGGGILIDASTRGEALAAVRGDRSAPLENTASATAGPLTSDAQSVLEWLGTARFDLSMPLESLARAVRDLAAQIEDLSTGSVGMSGDSAVPIEVTARLTNDIGTPAAWALSVLLMTDTGGPIEIGRETPAPPPPIYQVSSVRVRLLKG